MDIDKVFLGMASLSRAGLAIGFLLEESFRSLFVTVC
jgi:hypothetical protein